MKLIIHLSEDQQKQLMSELVVSLKTQMQMLCWIADRYEVDRNELADLYQNKLRRYLDSCDLSNEKIPAVNATLKWLEKAIKRGK